MSEHEAHNHLDRIYKALCCETGEGAVQRILDLRRAEHELEAVTRERDLAQAESIRLREALANLRIAANAAAFGAANGPVSRDCMGRILDTLMHGIEGADAATSSPSSKPLTVQPSADREAKPGLGLCPKCGHPKHESRMHQDICTFYVPSMGAECGCSEGMRQELAVEREGAQFYNWKAATVMVERDSLRAELATRPTAVALASCEQELRHALDEKCGAFALLEKVEERERLLREALKALTAEVKGLLGLAPIAICDAVGNTNVGCVQRRVQQAEAVLATPEGNK